MPSRQDQLHSYQFTVQRVVAALVMRETDPAQSPFRRAAGATLASVLIAVIALGAVAVYGVFVGGGSDSWRDSSAVIVEKESGARYVYRENRLYPVTNYASALLIAGSAAKTLTVSRKSMEGVARGVTLGITDAPDSLPPKDRLAGVPWSVCSGSLAENGQAVTRSVLLVGDKPRDGGDLGKQGLLVKAPGGAAFLIWNNQRHEIRDRQILTAPGWNVRASVSAAFINAIPAGAALTIPQIEGLGHRSTALPDRRIGEIVSADKGNAGAATGTDDIEYAVVLDDGVAVISQLQRFLLVTDPAWAAATRRTKEQNLDPGAYSQLKQNASRRQLLPSANGGLPPSVPAFADAGSGALCAVVADDSGGVTQIRVAATMPTVSSTVRTPGGAVYADYVVVTPGRGAVVQSLSSPDAPGGTYALVTDLGRRFPVSKLDTLAALGFGGVRPVRLPSSLVSLIPEGHELSPEAARQPVGQS